MGSKASKTNKVATNDDGDEDEKSVASASSAAESTHASFTTGGNYAIQTVGVLPFDVCFVRFDHFKSHGRFPSYSDNMLIRNENIENRDSAIAVFISHNWFRGLPEVEGKPDCLIITNKPDNSNNIKYELCVKGISELLQLCAPQTKDSEVYIWLDYSCLEFHNEICHLDRIMECCDCLFTPIFGTSYELTHSGGGASAEVHVKGLTANAYNEYQATFWNGFGPEAYLNRAWCRLEILYGAVIPIGRFQNNHIKQSNKIIASNSSDSVSIQSNKTKKGHKKGKKNDSSSDSPAPHHLASSSSSSHSQHQRHSQQNETLRRIFQGGLRYHISHGRRPHVLYGMREMQKGDPPIILPPLQSVFFDKYSPTTGYVTIPRDVRLIKRLLDDLQPHIVSVGRGYRGDLNSNGEMHGYGEFRYANGDIYEGQWKHDKKCGYGVMKYPHHGLYSGEFRDDMPWGHGLYHHSNGDVFEGEFKKGLYHSSDRGVLSTLTYANGDKYVGQFKEGRLTGKGTFWYNDGKRKGDVYEGEFFEDLRHGKGTYTAADGSVYTGDWIAHRRHGMGLQIYAGGSSYEGEFADGHKNGLGKFCYTSGDVHEGRYKKGQMDGLGRFTYITGSVFEGYFKDDMKEGAGVVRHTNGDYFEGHWQKDRKFGPGVYRHENGTVFFPDANEQETF